MIRARLAALRDNNRTPNFLQRNIIELAKYGYFFRPTNNSFHTDLIDRLATLDPEYTPALGSPGHSTPRSTGLPARRDICLGPGNPTIAKMYSFGSDLCNMLHKHINPTNVQTHRIFEASYWHSALEDFYTDNLTAETLAHACWDTAQCRAQRFRDAYHIRVDSHGKR